MRRRRIPAWTVMPLVAAACLRIQAAAGEAVAVGPREIAADVVVYGATAAGLAAAIQAARMGRDVIVVEASSHVGGMTTGGLSSSDVGKAWSIGGLASEFYARVGRAYGPSERQAFGVDGRVFHFEPKVAQGVFDAWLREAGVSYTVGREPEPQYGESLAGLRLGDRTPRPQYTQGDKDHFTTAVDPYVKPGDPASGLLPWVKEVDVTTFVNGVGDKGLQAYNYRLCVTEDPANRVPFEKPEGYRELDHELLLRVLESGDVRLPILIHKLPNRKFDWNSMHAVGTDLPGANWDYPEADHAERRRIAAVHALYAKGVMWTLANHPRVPESIRRVVSRHGWCKDEFVATGGFPPQFYVREGRRMLSDAVVTQGVCMCQEPCDDPAVCHDPGATARRRRGALRRRRPAVTPQAAGLVRKDD